MSTTKQNILIRLLKNVTTDSPSNEFSESLMLQLQSNAEESLITDGSFSDLINQTETDVPSVGFTDDIISKLKTQAPQVSYHPLISKRASLLFAATFLVLVILSFITKESSQVKATESSYFEILNNTILSLLQSFAQETTLIILCIISFSALLCIDFIYKSRAL